MNLVTPDLAGKRGVWQILLLVAGFLVLSAVSAASVIFVNRARQDNAWVVHTAEVVGQISTVLLKLRHAESAARGYLLTQQPQFLAEYEMAAAGIPPDLDKLTETAGDNPVQIENSRRLRPLIQDRLAEFADMVDLTKRQNTGGAIARIREASARDTVGRIDEVARAMRSEEERLFALRNASAEHSEILASSVTMAGSGMVIALAAVSIFLVRRSARRRDTAEALLRDNNLNLESTVEERTADLREANQEIQRFAYIVSHDLRSPLVNIMGFTSELEELRGEIFRRIAILSNPAPLVPDAAAASEPPLAEPDLQLSADFAEALGFIKSSIAKMDRLIGAILNLTREGRREFHPERIDTRELIESVATTVAHQAAEANAQIRIEPLPELVSDRLALEQIFSNLIDNALKYLKPGVPGDLLVRGRTKLGFAIYEVIDNGRGIDPRDHQRIFELFRRAGLQDRPGQGIGLAHVRALVRRLGGTLSVSSQLDQGSTFTITLPTKWTASRDQIA